MRRIIVFGNSGSGKSTLARRLVREGILAHLDLDQIAWLPVTPPARESLENSRIQIDNFVGSNDSWVIEGCYADLLQLAAPMANEMVFLNPGIEQCVKNARSRPWEPDKYESKEAQDTNLEMLIEWISRYADRNDEFSLRAHQQLFDAFTGDKKMITQNEGSA